MRFLLDEMFPDQVAVLLRGSGHEADGVRDVGLANTEDCVPVVMALKKRRPNGAAAMSYVLADRLTEWCKRNPSLYPRVHWLD